MNSDTMVYVLFQADIRHLLSPELQTLVQAAMCHNPQDAADYCEYVLGWDRSTLDFYPRVIDWRKTHGRSTPQN